MQYEDILQHVGGFGKYQVIVFVCLVLGKAPLSSQFLAQVFLAADTAHWCVVPGNLAANCSQLDTVSECQEAQKRQWIPYELDPEGNRIYSSCERYATADEGDTGDDQSLNSTDVVPCDAGWDFDQSRYKSTINEDFNLVCDREDLAGIAQSVWFAGLLAGSLVWGTVGDWFGRKKTFILCLLLVPISSVVTAFVPSFAVYTAIRFITAACAYGAILMVFVTITELVGPEKRVMVGSLNSLSFSLGCILLAGMAYFFREWRHLQLAISLPVLLSFLVLIVMPESPRWLMSKGRFDAAMKVMAKVNGTTVPENALDVSDSQAAAEKQPRPTVTQLDLVRTPNLRKISIVLWLDWFVVNLVFYGLSLSTSSLGIDDYVGMFVTGFIEIPSLFFCWFVMDRFGRRLSLAALYVLGGVFCLITIFIPLGAARAVVAMVGKFAISAAFTHIYIYSCELYPTVTRSMGVGVCSMVARVSGILAPIILILKKYWGPLPLCVFGGSAVVVGVLSLLLPETLGRNLPDTIEEGEMFGKSPGFRLFLQRDPQGERADSTQPPAEYVPLPTREVAATAPV